LKPIILQNTMQALKFLLTKNTYRLYYIRTDHLVSLREIDAIYILET